MKKIFGIANGEKEPEPEHLKKPNALVFITTWQALIDEFGISYIKNGKRYLTVEEWDKVKSKMQELENTVKNYIREIDYATQTLKSGYNTIKGILETQMVDYTPTQEKVIEEAKKKVEEEKAKYVEIKKEAEKKPEITPIPEEKPMEMGFGMGNLMILGALIGAGTLIYNLFFRRKT